MKNEDPLLKCNSSRVSTDLRILLLEIKPNVCGKGECAHTYTPVWGGRERGRRQTHTHHSNTLISSLYKNRKSINTPCFRWRLMEELWN